MEDNEHFTHVSVASMEAEELNNIFSNKNVQLSMTGRIQEKGITNK